VPARFLHPRTALVTFHFVRLSIVEQEEEFVLILHHKCVRSLRILQYSLGGAR
jgi:hypothetical protein